MAKPAKIELPADLTQSFPVPEDATAADIDAMVRQVQADADKLLGDKETNLEGATWLLDTVDVLNARKGELVAVEQERQAALDAARERLNANRPKDQDGDDSGDEGDDDEHKDGDEPEGGEGAAGGSGDATGDAVDAANGQPVLVASARFRDKRINVIRAAAQAQGGKPNGQPQDVKVREAYLTAAAEVKGYAAGQRIGWTDFGAAAESRFGQLPSALVRGAGRSQLPIGSVHVESDAQLVASAGRGDFAEIEQAIEWALSNRRLEQETGEQSLVAAGGWCAPSETLYDLLNMTTADGLLNIPGITVNRGGVRFTLGPNFATVFNSGALFTKTETQAIAGSAKPVVNIPCPAFADHRMVVDGIYLTGDILSQKGYPEAYADYTTKSLTAFQHYVNAATIADMEALCTQVDMTQAASSPTFFENPSAATELLGAVELQIVDMRYRNRLSLTNSVELVFPYYAKGIIRSDLAKRAALVNPASISDADIEQFFTLRGASVQWVLDWQDAFSGVSGGLGSATPVTSWPAQVKFMIYPQGAFVRALSDVIELSAVYDSTLLTTNQYVALFMEQARLTLLRAWDVREVKVNAKITGATGAAYDYTTKQPNA